MHKAQPLSTKALLDEYSDPEWRASGLELLALRTFLDHCIIDANYRISDDLNAAIALSPAGDRAMRELIKEKVPVKEARLLCFLEFAHVEPLIDVTEMDATALAAAVSAQMLKGQIRLPFEYGPLLYMKAASMFPDRRAYLGISETNRLLEDTPLGVYQMDQWVSGPYGLICSRAKRGFPARHSIPLQHCSDVSCSEVHDTRLDTDRAAPINEHRPKMARLMEAESEKPSEWSSFWSEVNRDAMRIYDDLSTDTVVLLLGDAFGDVELRTVLAELLDSTEGKLRRQVEPLDLRGAGEQIAGGLDRARLLQLCFLCTNDELSGAIDRLVHEKKVIIPQGELRRPTLHEMYGTGAFQLRAEVSELGVRSRSSVALGPLRLRRLVDDIYPTDRIELAQELEWQLRGRRASPWLPNWTSSCGPRILTSFFAAWCWRDASMSTGPAIL